jgi:antitoxin YefM
MAKVALDLGEDIQPVSDFRAHASAMLKQTRDSGRPIVLTQRGRSAAVLIDIAAYQALLDEVEELRSVCEGLADVEAGRIVSHEDVKQGVLARFKRS